MTRHSGSMGTAPRTAPVPDVPEQVPGYRELTRIGHGGFSVVYRAVQESFERDVALKLLTVVGPDEDARRRFVREVRLAGRLSDHPHVVTVLDTGTTAAGRPYLAMDLYDGGSMKQWLTRRGPLSGVRAAGVGAKIADALHAAHALGVLHRDVKPNNILISRYGEPALADFGVSWLLDASNSSSVLDVFSPQHAAPELMTRGVPTASSDVYALGSTLYELIAGRPPFGGSGQDVRRTIYLALSEPAPPLECPDLPGIAEVIERAMAKEPEDRWPDAASFGRALRALIPEGVSSALVMGDGPAAVPTTSATVAMPADLVPSLDSYSPDGDDDYVSGPDETMLRPDRVDGDAPIPSPRGGGSRRRPDDRRGADGGRGVDAARGAGVARGADTARGAGAARGADTARARSAGTTGRSGPSRPSGRGGGDRWDARDGRGAAGSGDRRGLGKPLALAAAVLLVAVGAWTALSSQGSGTPKADAVAPGQSPTATSADPVSSASAGPSTSTQSSSKSSSSSSPSPTRHSSSSAPTHAVTSATTSAGAGLPSPSSAPPTGPLLPTSFHRLRNSAAGDCLAQPPGSGSAVHSACADVKGQGWQSTPSGLLGAVTGAEQLVNGDSSGCLTGGSGGVSVRSCGSEMSQVWTKTGGSGGASEYQNSADLLCLKASGGSLAEAACDGDAGELWADDGNV